MTGVRRALDLALGGGAGAADDGAEDAKATRRRDGAVHRRSGSESSATTTTRLPSARTSESGASDDGEHAWLARRQSSRTAEPSAQSEAGAVKESQEPEPSVSVPDRADEAASASADSVDDSATTRNSAGLYNAPPLASRDQTPPSPSPAASTLPDNASAPHASGTESSEADSFASAASLHSPDKAAPDAGPPREEASQAESVVSALSADESFEGDTRPLLAAEQPAGAPGGKATPGDKAAPGGKAAPAGTPPRPVLARADVFSPQPRGVLPHMDEAAGDGAWVGDGGRRSREGS